jgi:hypothetical protein
MVTITIRPCGTSATSTAAARTDSTRSKPPLRTHSEIATGIAVKATSRLIARITRATSSWMGVMSSL